MDTSAVILASMVLVLVLLSAMFYVLYVRRIRRLVEEKRKALLRAGEELKKGVEYAERGEYDKAMDQIAKAKEWDTNQELEEEE